MALTPTLAEVLPDLDAFVDELSASVSRGGLAGHDEFVRYCQDFYTSARTAEIDDAVQGWAAMASYQGGITLWHTTAALMSLRALDEYQSAAVRTRHVMDWAVLLHDLAKKPGRGRDHRHAFRSAATAGRVLPQVGFETRGAWLDDCEAWFSVADTAHRFDASTGEFVQDNEKLPAIIDGAARLYGQDATVVLTAIALHLSVTVVADWPARTPLTEAEERRFIDQATRPVLLATMLADHGGWNTFEPDTLQTYYKQTRSVFNRLERQPLPDPTYEPRSSG